ncbi:hypothetical protein [Tardiphaga sp. 839_C3_N1_4]|uniref:hypothetical protein n=1 Tax=Tardiphaga sp. 839_C3_N1_4 TaxID=3240761 RepID=UPI003F20E3A3
MSDVEIELNGKFETLRCTLKAGKLVNSGGGFGEVLRKLAVFDMDAYVHVVAAGLGRKPADVEEAVYKTGLVDLTEKLSEFVMLLANGGRPLAAGSGDGAAGEA